MKPDPFFGLLGWLGFEKCLFFVFCCVFFLFFLFLLVLGFFVFVEFLDLFSRGIRCVCNVVFFVVVI